LTAFNIDADVQAFYFLLMHNFRITADAFTHYGLLGFQCEEEIQKNKSYYMDKALQCSNQCGRVQKMVL
jgi:hypothetical protein